MSSAKKLLRPCPVCKHTAGSILRAQRFILAEGHPLRDGYEVVCCDRCGFVFADTSATQEDYDRFYASFSKYEDNKTSTGGGENPLDAARLQQTAECIAGVVGNQSARIVDIGCANGGMLLALKRLGFANLHGLDLPRGCVENTRRLGIPADFGSVYSFPDGIGRFDVVILSHVMEHLRDLRGAVANLSKLLAPGGQIYIEVPDASEYASHVVAPFQDFNTEHINHFSILGMENLLGQFGYASRATGVKVMEAAPRMPYPAHYAFWSQTGNNPADFKIKKDEVLVQRIERFIAISQAMMDDIDARLQTALAKSPEVIVWGVGQLAMKLLVETSLSRAKIVAFADGNPVNHGKTLRGIPIKNPAAISSLPQPIVIATTLHQQAIADRIRNELRLPNELIFLA